MFLVVSLSRGQRRLCVLGTRLLLWNTWELKHLSSSRHKHKDLLYFKRELKSPHRVWTVNENHFLPGLRWNHELGKQKWTCEAFLEFCSLCCRDAWNGFLIGAAGSSEDPQNVPRITARLKSAALLSFFNINPSVLTCSDPGLKSSSGPPPLSFSSAFHVVSENICCVKSFCVDLKYICFHSEPLQVHFWDFF